MLVSALLGAGLFALIQRASGVPGDRARAGVVRGYMLEHPEMLPEAMDRLQARETARYEKAQQGAQAAVPQHLAQLQALCRRLGGQPERRRHRRRVHGL